jgi:6-phosphofructokinase 1
MSDRSCHSIRRIGVLTGGGDCPGLNAVIRAVTKSAIMNYGLEVYGIEDGFLGLIQNRIHPLTTSDVSNILTTGGTILGSSNKADPARYAIDTDEHGRPVFADVTDHCLEHLKQHAIDALVVIGGDGTMSGAANFVKHGINCIGVPKTIDNDLEGTDVTFGFMTAVEVASWALDRVHTTAASHHRVMAVEVMGRNAGWIALYAGVASGADVILIPEIPFDWNIVAQYVTHRQKHGKRFSIMCVSEGAKPEGGEQIVKHVDPTSPDPIRLGGIGKFIADGIAERTGIETRTTVLGHIQRGGTPSVSDRILGTHFGYHAVELLMSGARSRLVVMKRNEISDTDILTAAHKQRVVPINHPLIEAARAVGTCFGDLPPVKTR